MQKPHPPIWQVGTSAKWVPRAVKKGWGICLGGPAPNIAFTDAIEQYHAAVADAGTKSNFGYSKAVYLDEDNDKAIEEGREALINFIHFNVSPMDSLPRTTPEEKQRLIDAGYAFYAPTTSRTPATSATSSCSSTRSSTRARRRRSASSSSTSGTSSASTSSCSSATTAARGAGRR